MMFRVEKTRKKEEEMMKIESPIEKTKFMWSLFYSPIPQTEFTTKPSLNRENKFNYFAYVTSPLRRYSDLLSHFQLKSFLKRSPLPFSFKQVETISSSLQKITKSSSLLQKNSYLLSTFYFLESNPSHIYSAFLINRSASSSLDSSGFDSSSNTFKKGYVHSLVLFELNFVIPWVTPKSIPLGQIFHVRCTSVDPLWHKATFECLD